MNDLTAGNIFDKLYFLGTCVAPYASASGLAAIESECQKATQRAHDLTRPSDEARDARNVIQAQRNSLADLAQVERTNYESTGSARAFRAILAAATPDERIALAATHAADGARIKSLASAVEHADGYLLPKLTIVAQRADCDWLEQVARMSAWAAILAGVKRHIAAAPLMQQENMVSFPDSGATHDALTAAAQAKGRYHSAAESLAQMERNFNGGNYAK